MFPHAIWSCGESSKNLNSFYFPYTNPIRELSHDYVSIGDTSLKISISLLNDAYYADYRSNLDFNELNKTVTFQADIYSNYDCRLCIYIYTGSYTSSYTTIPVNVQGTYSVTKTIPENTTQIIYRVEPRVYSHDDAFVYMDNWQLIIQ